jgi:hypothetical protein
MVRALQSLRGLHSFSPLCPIRPSPEPPPDCPSVTCSSDAQFPSAAPTPYPTEVRHAPIPAKALTVRRSPHLLSLVIQAPTPSPTPFPTKAPTDFPTAVSPPSPLLHRYASTTALHTLMCASPQTPTATPTPSPTKEPTAEPTQLPTYVSPSRADLAISPPRLTS